MQKTTHPETKIVKITKNLIIAKVELDNLNF